MMKHFLISSIALLAIITTTAQPATTPPVYPKTIEVSGSAEMEVTPDEIYVQVTLREYDKKNAGKISIETIREQFQKAAKQAGIADSNITVSSFSGFDRFYTQKQKKMPDLKALITYEVRFKSLAQIDALVPKLDDEATESFRVTRTSHSNISAFRKQLKIDAVKAAKEKAIYLAGAINERVEEAIKIEEPQESIFPIYERNAMLSNMAVSQTIINGDNSGGVGEAYKKIKLRYEVKAVFALR